MPGDNRKGETRKGEAMKNLTEDQIIEKALQILESRIFNGDTLDSPAATVNFLKLKLAVASFLDRFQASYFDDISYLL